MADAKCSNCGNWFSRDGLFSSSICGACKRAGNIAEEARAQDAAHQGNMQSIAAASAIAQDEQARQQTAAAMVVAAKQFEAAERQARAAEQVAAAQSEAAKSQARAALAQAVGSLDDEGLRRFKEQEARDTDKKATDDVLDKIGAAVACIESEGKSTDKINRNAYPTDQSDVSNANGLGQAVSWHNLVAAQQMLTEAREQVVRITHWSAPISRESCLERAERFIQTAKKSRTDRAKEVVTTIRKIRTLIQGAGVLLLALAAALGGIAVASPEGEGMSVGLVAAFAGSFGFSALMLSSTPASAKAPIAFDDIQKDAGTITFSAGTVWSAIAGIAGLIVLAGLIASVRILRGTVDPRELVTGTWARDGHSLTVTASAIRLDNGVQNLVLRPGLGRESNTIATFREALLHEGVFSDDHCSGSLETRGSTLVVVASGHNDCAGFSGNWARATPTTSNALSRPVENDTAAATARAEAERQWLMQEAADVRRRAQEAEQARVAAHRPGRDGGARHGRDSFRDLGL